MGRMSNEARASIRESYGEGLSVEAIAEIHGVTTKTIAKIVEADQLERPASSEDDLAEFWKQKYLVAVMKLAEAGLIEL